MNELVYYIQGNFGGSEWEDLSGYPCGNTEKQLEEARESCNYDLAQYRASGQGIYRVVRRYEKIAE